MMFGMDIHSALKKDLDEARSKLKPNPLHTLLHSLNKTEPKHDDYCGGCSAPLNPAEKVCRYCGRLY